MNKYEHRHPKLNFRIVILGKQYMLSAIYGGCISGEGGGWGGCEFRDLKEAYCAFAALKPSFWTLSFLVECALKLLSGL